MRNNLLLFIILLPFQLMTQTLLSGTLKNYDHQFITLGKVSSYELLSEADTIFLNDGAFEVKLQLKQLAAINIDFFFFFDDQEFRQVLIFVSPGDRVHFEIDFEKDSGISSCKFSGSNAVGHDLFYWYKVHPVSVHSAHFEENIHSQTDAVAAYKLFTADMDTFIAPYKKLKK